MKKRIISLALAVLLICSISVFASADSAVNEARKGVALIECIVVSDDENWAESKSGWGSGFFVGDGNGPVQYMITNCHVVENYLIYGAGAVIDTKNDYGTNIKAQSGLLVLFDEETAVEAYVLDYDVNQDIAILKLENSTSERKALSLRVPTDDMVGETMYVIGYPGVAENDKIVSTTKFGAEDSIVAKGTLGRLITVSGQGTRWIGSTDIDINHGNSGGPILDENGAVIGVACQSYSEIPDKIETMNYCVNIEAVVEMLRRNEVPFELADEAVEEPVPTEEPEQPAPTPTPAPVEEESGISPVIIAAISVAIVAVIAVVLVVAKKKKNQSDRYSVRANRKDCARAESGCHKGACSCCSLACTAAQQAEGGDKVEPHHYWPHQ